MYTCTMNRWKFTSSHGNLLKFGTKRQNCINIYLYLTRTQNCFFLTYYKNLDLIIKNVIILKSYKTYSNKILCFKLISLVSKVQRMKPFIEGVIQSKIQVFFTQSCSKLTCKRNKMAIMIMKFFIFVWYAYKWNTEREILYLIFVIQPSIYL